MYGFDLNLEGIGAAFGNATKEGLDELNANLRAFNRTKAAELILSLPEEGNMVAKSQAVDTLIKIMKGKF